MLDTSNVTLEEINYDQEGSISRISRISHIKYQEDFGFLEDFSFNGQHLALSEIRLQPQKDHCEIQFFEGEEEDVKRKGSSDSEGNNFSRHRKIGTLTLREDNFFKGPLKLPLAKSSIFLKVQSKSNQPLHGKLAKNDDGDGDIELFDTQGIRKGNLKYHLESKFSMKQQFLEHDDTLHSNQFLADFSPKRQQTKREPSPPPKYQKIDIKSKVTLNNSLVDASKRHKGSDDQDNRSEKSQIDYMGYESSNKIERVAEYRLPIDQKAAPEVKQVDYLSIRRSMEDLGLSNHYSIEAYLQRSKVPYEGLKEITQEYHQSATSQAHVSFQESSSQADDSKRQVMERGTGTQTPIPCQINEEMENNSSHIYKQSRGSQRSKSIQYQQDIIAEKQTAKGEERISRNSHLPQTHFVRSKQVDSSFQADTMKPERFLPKQPAQLSMRNNVYQLKLGSSRINQRNQSRQSKERDWMSCKQSLSNNINKDNSDYGSQQMLYPQADIIINNLSVNFHRKCFGSKMLQLSIAPTTYCTEELAGNNLIWIGKQYIFKGVGGSNQLNVCLKKSVDETQSTLAQVKIKVSDLILNKKKCYFQTFLLSKKEVVAILIIGFQIVKKNYNINNRQVFPLKATRQTHAQTELSRSKTTKIKRHSRSPRKKFQRIQTRQAALPSPRLNPIRVRKYQGGRNIKIGRASRFEADSRGIPGPGDYQIESSFSRHALKDI